MGYLDSAGLAHFTAWVKGRLSGKQNALTPDGSVKIQGGNIGVSAPVRGIVTQAEFDALPEAERNKGLYVVSDGGEGGGSSGGESAGELYSTEETRIGTWIDGKPLYRRVINSTTPATTGQNHVILEGIQIDRIVRFSGFVYPASGYPDSIVYTATNSKINVSYWGNGSLVMFMTSSVNTSRPYNITLEYTKTTDEGGTA